MASGWFSGKCGGPRVLPLSNGQGYEIEGIGRKTLAITSGVKSFESIIKQWAATYGVPDAVVAGVMMTESKGDPKAVNPVDGGVGLMQLTWPPLKEGHSNQELLDDPSLNVQLGTKLLGKLWKSYRGNIIHVLTAYNAGGAECKEDSGDPWNFKDTGNYVGTTLPYINGAVDSGLFSTNMPSSLPVVPPVEPHEPSMVPHFLVGAAACALGFALVSYWPQVSRFAKRTYRSVLT